MNTRTLATGTGYKIYYYSDSNGANIDGLFYIEDSKHKLAQTYRTFRGLYEHLFYNDYESDPRTFRNKCNIEPLMNIDPMHILHLIYEDEPERFNSYYRNECRGCNIEQALYYYYEDEMLGGAIA